MKSMSFKRAMDAMHLSGTRLVRASDGRHCVVPGGPVDPPTAEKIKANAGVVPIADKQFAGCQVWQFRG